VKNGPPQPAQLVKPTPEGAVATTDSAVDFPGVNDLKAFTSIGGMWKMGKHGLSNSGDSFLERREMGKYDSMKLVLYPIISKGTATIQLSGLTLSIDLERSIWQIRSRQESLPEKPVAILPRTQNVFNFQYDKAKEGAMIDLNNGMQSISIRDREVPDSMTIKVVNGAVLSISELTFKRNEGLVK
jgi:hypothetical protein